MNNEPLLPLQEHIKKKVKERRHTAALARPGAGKTRPVLEALHEEGATASPILVVVWATSAMFTWGKEAAKWLDFPQDKVFYVRGDAQQRGWLWSQAQQGVPGIYVVNASNMHRDVEQAIRGRWAALIVDEYHHFAQNHKAPTYLSLSRIQRGTRYVIYVSGSLGGRDTTHLYTLFKLADPKRWRSYYKYRNAFNEVVEGPWGGHEVVGPRNLEVFKQWIDHYCAWIPPEVVADQQPKGTRQMHDIQMSVVQQKIYTDLLEEQMHLADSGELVFAQNAMHEVLQFRKLLCSPKLLDPQSTDFGAGIEYIAEHIMNEDRHAVIFCPFRAGCDYMREYLELCGYDRSIGILRGQVAIEEQTRILEQFRSDHGVIISTIDYAESWDAETCETTWHLGYAFRLDPNLQCEGRIQRVNNPHPFIRWNYLRYANTYDKHYIGQIGLESRTTRELASRPQSFIDILKGNEPSTET